jgi:hypothetical protein
MTLYKSTQLERGSQDFFKKLTQYQSAFSLGLLLSKKSIERRKKVLLLQEFIKKIDSDVTDQHQSN